MSRKPEDLGDATDRVLRVWNTYLDDDTTFDALAVAINRLAAARAGRPWQPNTQRKAFDSAGSVSLLDLTREERAFEPGK